MPIFNWLPQMPFTDMHQLDLDWLISKYKKLEDDEETIQESLEGAEAAKEDAEAAATDAANSATAAAGSAMEAAGSAEDAADTADSISDSLNQIAVNTSRIDNLVANAGDTDNNAELLDIRVGYDGTVFNTAGDAVRGQVETAENDIASITNLKTYTETQTTTAGGSHRIDIHSLPGDVWTIFNNSSTTITVQVGNAGGEIAYGNLYAGHSIEFTPGITTTYFRYWVAAATVDITIETRTPLNKALAWIDGNLKQAALDTSGWSYGFAWYWSSGGASLPWADRTQYAVSSPAKLFMYAGTKIECDAGYQFRIYYTNGSNVTESTRWGSSTHILTENTYSYISVKSADNSDVGAATISEHFTVTPPLYGIVDTINDTVSGHGDMIGYDRYYLPDYWLTYLSEKYNDISDAVETIGYHGESFAFITDCHLDNNQMNGIKAIEHIVRNTNVQKVINGGDFINDQESTSAAIQQLRTWAYYARDLNMICLTGNHDRNNNYNNDYAISDEVFYGTLMLPAENTIVYGGNLFGYEDNNNQKIRHIYLNTGAPDTATISNTQITWMIDRITELPAGWTVLIFAHQLYASDGTFPAYDSNGIAITTALNSIYDGTNAIIAALIGGHSHRDYIDTSNPYPIILTTCDAIQQPDNTGRTIGTTNEQAFDIFHVNTATRVISTTRIGYGANRTIAY